MLSMDFRLYRVSFSRCHAVMIWVRRERERERERERKKERGRESVCVRERERTFVEVYLGQSPYVSSYLFTWRAVVVFVNIINLPFPPRERCFGPFFKSVWCSLGRSEHAGTVIW